MHVAESEAQVQSHRRSDLPLIEDEKLELVELLSEPLGGICNLLEGEGAHSGDLLSPMEVRREEMSPAEREGASSGVLFIFRLLLLAECLKETVLYEL